jgi:hypothetical protein
MAKITYQDKEKSKNSGLPDKNTARAEDFNEIKNSVNYLYDNPSSGVSADSVGQTEQKDELKGRVDMGVGTNIDWSLGVTYVHDQLTGNLTLTDANLPQGTDTKDITLDLDLNGFTLTFPAYYVSKGGEVSASGKTRIVIGCVNGNNGSEEVYYSLIPNA